MSYIARIDSSGHGTVIEWDVDDARSVSAARKAFETLKAAGFAFFELTGDREQGDPIRGDFDPSVEGILAIPQLQGG